MRVFGVSEGRAAGSLVYVPRPDRQLASRPPLSARTGCAPHARRRPISHTGRALRGGCTAQRVAGGKAVRRRRRSREGGLICSSSQARRAVTPPLTLRPAPGVLARAVCAAMHTRTPVRCAGECGAHAWYGQFHGCWGAAGGGEMLKCLAPPARDSRAPHALRFAPRARVHAHHWRAATMAAGSASCMARSAVAGRDGTTRHGGARRGAFKS